LSTKLALFRGINVGGRNKLPMKDLAGLLAGLGLEDVHTYLQSGNVVFECVDPKDSGLAPRIQEAIRAAHGFSPEVFILDRDALAEAVAGNPFPEADSDPRSVHLTFLSAVPTDPDLRTLEAIRSPSERFRLQGRVFYLHAPQGIGKSKLAARLEGALGVAGTSRNWRTVVRLREMVGA
jgi:uncharacterized protein (DUF1697 family)